MAGDYLVRMLLLGRVKVIDTWPCLCLSRLLLECNVFKLLRFETGREVFRKQQFYYDCTDGQKQCRNYIVARNNCMLFCIGEEYSFASCKERHCWVHEQED